MKIQCSYCQLHFSKEIGVDCDCGNYCGQDCLKLAHDRMVKATYHLDELAAMGFKVELTEANGVTSYEVGSPDNPVPYLSKQADFISETDALPPARKTHGSN